MTSGRNHASESFAPPVRPLPRAARGLKTAATGDRRSGTVFRNTAQQRPERLPIVIDLSGEIDILCAAQLCDLTGALKMECG